MRAASRVLALLAFAFAMAGCAVLEPGPPPTTEVTVFFATDRALEPDGKTFGSRHATETIRGTATVSIPPGHELGNVERPGWFRRMFGLAADPDLHMVLMGIRTMSVEDFYQAMSNDSVAEAANKSVFIFVHGYNNTFEDAALRTAQLAVDLRLPTVPVFYSWPSRGEEAKYLHDASSALWAEPRFVAFLEEFSSRSDATKIYLIAHSMGARIAARGMATLLERKPDLANRFREVLLAAPDISAEIFKDNIAPRLRQAGASVTVYASSHDKTMRLSKLANGMVRLGDAADGLVLMSGVETIDASAIPTDFLSHGYFASTRALVTDIALLLGHGLRAASRPTLVPKALNGDRYWAFVP